MPKCTIDGKEVNFTPGQNMIEVAREAGIEIPYFCYHPGLSIVAQCRMCAIEVEKMPKLQTACSTPVADGMVIKTQSERVKKNQRSVMEFLLINHPLDCPICDKSGECDLQDNSFKFGDAYTRYTEERRTYMDLDMGPVIKKNMNRCIHCTRCIRFGEEVAGIHEMVAVQRGNNTEITTVDGKALETEYAGNYADICPTGSLTVRDFRFRKRVWYLKKTPTVCEGCSRGCNLEIHQDAGVIYRQVPRFNAEINKHWLCDEGRFSFNTVNSPDRVVTPRISGADVTWSQALDEARTIAKSKHSVLVLIGSDLTVEEGQNIKDFAQRELRGSKFAHFGTPGILKASDDGDEDKILRRLSKTSNLHGLEAMGIAGLDQVPAGTDCVVVFRGGRAVLPKNLRGTVIGVGVFTAEESQHFKAVLPGPTYAEKSGTIVNSQGHSQKFQAAIPLQGSAKQITEILMMWVNSQGASRGRDVSA